MADFSLKFAFFCEDVRREDNGKIFVLGAMAAGSITAREFPVKKRLLHAYVVAEVSVRKIDVNYKLIRKGARKPCSEGGLGFEYTGDRDVAELPIDFGIDLNGTVFDVPGEYQLRLSTDEDKWKTATTILVSKASDDE